MNKWLVVAVLITAAATGASMLALRDPGALAGSVARRCGGQPCVASPARSDFCTTDYCGHGGADPKPGYCLDAYCGRAARSTPP